MDCGLFLAREDFVNDLSRCFDMFFLNISYDCDKLEKS
jgi:hypothetical protein